MDHEVGLAEVRLVRVVALQQVQENVDAIFDHDPPIAVTLCADDGQEVVERVLEGDDLLDLLVGARELAEQEDGVVSYHLAPVAEQVDCPGDPLGDDKDRVLHLGTLVLEEDPEEDGGRSANGKFLLIEKVQKHGDVFLVLDDDFAETHLRTGLSLSPLPLRRLLRHYWFPVG